MGSQEKYVWNELGWEVVDPVDALGGGVPLSDTDWDGLRSQVGEGAVSAVLVDLPVATFRGYSQQFRASHVYGRGYDRDLKEAFRGENYFIQQAVRLLLSASEADLPWIAFARNAPRARVSPFHLPEAKGLLRSEGTKAGALDACSFGSTTRSHIDFISGGINSDGLCFTCNHTSHPAGPALAPWSLPSALCGAIGKAFLRGSTSRVPKGWGPP